MSKKFKVALLLGFLTSRTVIGYIIGRETSPAASQPGTARWAVVMYGKWQRLDFNKGRLSLRAGGRTYSYSTGDSKVSVRYLSAEEIAAAPVPRYAYVGDLDLEKLLTLAVAAPVEGEVGVAFLKTTGKTEEILSGPERATIAATTLGAGAI